MKRILILAAIFLTLFSMTSCQEYETGDTRITYYASIELEGESVYIQQKGQDYVEPGYTAIMNGMDVTERVTVNHNIDINTSGVYSVSYSVVNDDGFTSSVYRTVIVIDTNDPVEGVYIVDASSDRDGTAGNYFTGNTVYVFGQGDGVYNLSCGLGGYYEQGRGYGSAYAADTYIQMDASGTTFSYIESYVAGWGDAIDTMTECSFDPATGTMSWIAAYAGMNFHVVMTKN